MTKRTKKPTNLTEAEKTMVDQDEWQRIRDMFDIDGVWLVSGDRSRMRNVGFGGYNTVRKIGRLLDPMELAVLCGFEQHRDALMEAVKEILQTYTSGGGISYDAGATMIIDAVHRAQMNNMKGITLDERDRPKDKPS